MKRWRWKEKAVQNIIKSGAFGNQTALFDAGLQPKHGFLQAHPTGTGLHGPNFIECVEKGKVNYCYYWFFFLLFYCFEIIFFRLLFFQF